MNEKENQIGVSVICLAYNHGRYIRKALEGFMSQITVFRYEVIIHDDASTDDTAAIICEYAEKYPDRIVPILQKENQYSKRVKLHPAFILPKVRGKYVAFCEGDDYWTDPHKLQKQYDLMEEFPDRAMVVHKVQAISDTEGILPRTYPMEQLQDRSPVDMQWLLDHFAQYPFQTSSYFMRTGLYRSLHLEPPVFKNAASVGDEPMVLYMAANGGLQYLADNMSCYRQFSSSSWSASQKKSLDRRIGMVESRYNMMKAFDEYTDHAYNCHLSLYEGRMLLYKGDFKALAAKRNEEYFKSLGLKKRLAVLAGAYIPGIGKYIAKKI